MCECTPVCRGAKMLVLGIILILARLVYPTWDIWVVIGAILAIKGIMLFVMPVCPCNKKKKK